MATRPAVVDDGWEDVDAWEDVSPAAPQASGWRGMLDSALRGGRAVVGGVQSVLDTPRSLYSDPLARAGAGMLGIKTTTTDPATGATRGRRADEMLLEAVMPGRESGARSTPEDFVGAAADMLPGVSTENALALRAAVRDNPLLRGLAGAATGPMGALGLVDEAVAKAGGEKTLTGKAARLAEDITRRPAGFVAGAITDPLTAASGAAIGKALGAGASGLKNLSRADQALAGAGALVGGAGALEAGGRAIEAARGGDFREAGLSALDALLAGGMSYVGARAARRMGRELPRTDRGQAYINDPRLTAEQRAALAAEAPAPAQAPEAAPAPAPAMRMPLDQVPAELHGRVFELGDEASHAMGKAAALDPKFDRRAAIDDVVARLPDDLQAHAQAIRDQLLQDSEATMTGIGFLDDIRRQVGDAGPDGITVHQTAEGFVVAQRRRGKLVGAADVMGGTPEQGGGSLQMLAGGKGIHGSRAKAWGISAGPLYETLDRLGVERPDKLTTRGLRARRGRATVAGDGARVLPPDVGAVGGEPGSPGLAGGRSPLPGDGGQPPGQAAAAAGAPTAGAAEAVAQAAPAAPDTFNPRAAREARLAAAQQAAQQPAAPGTGLGARAGRAVLRTVEPVLNTMERLPGVGRELAGRVRAFEHRAETLSGQWAARAERAMQGLGGTAAQRQRVFQELIQPAIEGRVAVDALPAPLQAAANELRALEAEVGQGLVKAGVIKPDALVENHWTRVPRDMSVMDFGARVRELAQQKGITPEAAAAELRAARGPVIATRAGRRIAAERERGAGKAGLQEGEYRTDAGVLFESLNDAARRIAEAEHLGKNGELAQALVDRIDPEGKGGKLGDRAWAEAKLNELRGVKPKTAADTVSSVVRGVQSAAGLVLSPLQQTTSLAQTAAVAGLRPTAKALRETLWSSKVTPEGHGMRRAADRVRRSWAQAKLDAAEAGALYTNLGGELADLYGTLGGAVPEGGGASGKLQRGVRAVPWLKAAGNVDMAQRVVAAKTAEFFVPKLVEQAQKGSAKAARDLAYLNVDWKGWKGTPAELGNAAKAISDRTQYRVGMTQLPGWTSTPLGKVAFQFQSFGYQHARFMGHLLNEARRGRVGPIARWAAVAIPLGLGAKEARDAIKGYGNDESPESVAKGLEDALTGRKNFDVTKDPLFAAVAGLAAAGGFGILQTAAEKSGEKSLAKLALGATGSDLANLGGTLSSAGAGIKDKLAQAWNEGAGDRPAAAAAQERAEKNFDAAAGGLARTAAGVLPNLPVVGPAELAREFGGEQKPARASHLGRLRDALEDARVLPVADETTRGTAGRAAQARLKRIQERTREQAAQNEAALTDKPGTPLGQRVAKAEKTEKREAFETQLIDAYRERDMKRVRAIMREAKRAKIIFRAKQLKQLQGRVTLVAPEEQEDEE